MDIIQVINIDKSYEKETSILKEVSFSINEGEILAFAGASGAGKTTLLKIISGTLGWEEGSISIFGELLAQPEERLVPLLDSIGFVFQDFQLDPYKTVFEHVSYAYRYCEIEEKTEKTNDILEDVALTPYANRKIKTLSGGQKQRLAIAGTLAQERPILIFDEPFSQLDTGLKAELLLKLKRRFRKEQTTAVFVLHQPEDALSIADRILVLKDGRIIQENTPTSIYQQPINQYVAELFGICNVYVENNVVRGVRPEDLVLSKDKTGAFSGEISELLFQGSRTLLIITTPINKFAAYTYEKGWSVGQKISFSFNPESTFLLK